MAMSCWRPLGAVFRTFRVPSFTIKSARERAASEKTITPASYSWKVTRSAVKASSSSERSLNSGSLRRVATRLDLSGGIWRMQILNQDARLTNGKWGNHWRQKAEASLFKPLENYGAP